MEETKKGKCEICGKETDDLRRFSGIHKKAIKNVPLSDVEGIGNQRLKRRHHHYIQK